MVDRNRSRRPGKHASKRVCALLWDESLAWGLMARRALQEAGLPFDLLRSEEIRQGALTRYRMLFVPGGWASNKLYALGGQGREKIRSFVEAGGHYLGICGGAGMATEDGMGLVPVRRKASTERVASFSGPIRIALARHQIWQGIQTPVFFAWWPSQFQSGDQRVRVLATYEEAGPDAFSSDIPVAEGRVIGWPDLEKRYGILLDPARLHGEPAVMEGRLGLGRVVLSLVHFDTPGDPNGAAVLQNLWDDLAPGWSSETRSGGISSHCHPLPALPPELVGCLGIVNSAVADLIEWGTKHSLWYWRNPLLLQWRRGVRGLEYGTLAVMIGEIGTRLDSPRPHAGRPRREGIDLQPLREGLDEIRVRIVPFVEEAKDLLERERFYMERAVLSPLECSDPAISRIRQSLFGTAMSHGGRFKQLIDTVDRILFSLIRDD
ncbi:MAG TPA: BPL-N domain-containing protein [Syntrophales bacterium]|nr:BPL-N domain-containing protein [Syntrophales bacterium]